MTSLPGHRTSTQHSQHVDRINSSSSAVANTNRYTNVFDGKRRAQSDVKGSSSVVSLRRSSLTSDNVTKDISLKSRGTRRLLRENSITLSSDCTTIKNHKTLEPSSLDHDDDDDDNDDENRILSTIPSPPPHAVTATMSPKTTKLRIAENHWNNK